MDWIPLKRVARIEAGQSPPSDEVEPLTFGKPFLQGNAEFGSRHPLARFECNYSRKGCLSGDVLLSVRAPVGALNIADQNYGIGRGLCAIRAESCDQRFLWWWLHHQVSALNAVATGSTYTAVTTEEVAGLSFPALSIEEQRQIANFLDAESDRIDRVMSAQEKARAALMERRRALVHHLVTGSKDLARRLSSLTWTNSIPKKWPEIKISFVARMGSGHTPSRSNPEWWTSCTVPWITTGEVSQVRDDRREKIVETREMISWAGIANSSAELHPAGTVVLSRTASAGFSAVMGRDMATSQDFVTWTCGPKLDPYYLLWCLRAMRSDLLGRLAMGSTHKTIYVPDLQTLRIPLPPIDEQRNIVARIRASNAEVDNLVDLIGRQQDLLFERKQALITAAVTGQFDPTTARSVRGT